MTSARIYRILPIVAVAFCLTSCIKTKFPLSDPDSSVPDARLFGTWITHLEDGGIEIMNIGIAAEAGDRKIPTGIMRSTSISINSKHRISKPGDNVFFVTSFGIENYLNAFSDDILDESKHKTWDKTAIRDYHLLKYRVTKDKLEYWIGNEKAIAQAIEKGAIRGTIDRYKDGSFMSASITDTTENLARFFRRGGGAALFPDEHKISYDRLYTNR